jgi:Glyoxalase-like domain
MTHPSTISRRLFLPLAAGAVAAPRLLFAQNEVPTLLDHLLLGVQNLETGIAFVESHTGVRAVFGGVHPGRGTQNALLSLGDRRYLEIIAPDPAQPDAKNPIAVEIRSLQQPRLVGWAAHPGNLSSFAEKLRAAGIAFQGPTPGSRKRPDGRLLQWQTLNLDDDSDGLLPFFIEWAPESPHPSSDAPKGCSLAQFSAQTPDSSKLLATLKLMSLDLPVQTGEKSRLRASITGPKGTLELSS